jgi:hypothetical protein
MSELIETKAAHFFYFNRFNPLASELILVNDVFRHKITFD